MPDPSFTFWTFLVDAFVIFLFVMWIFILIRVFGDLFRRSDMSGFGKVIWMILLLVLPYLGVFVYLITQGGNMARRDDESMSAARDQLRSSIGFSAADEITKLEKLKSEGKITADEFSKMRANLI